MPSPQASCYMPSHKLIQFCLSSVFTLYAICAVWLEKLTNELTKWLNPDLPSYYYTSAHSRFYEGVLPDFSVQAIKPRKPRCAPQHELLGASQRVTTAVRGAGSMQATFHNVPVDVPPSQCFCYHPGDIWTLLHVSGDIQTDTENSK